MQSLKPTGLPPDSSRSRAMKCISSQRRRERACGAPARRSRRPIGTPRASAISARDLRRRAARRHGRAWRPGESLISIILTCGSARMSRRSARGEPAVGVAAAEVAAADLPDDVAADLAVIAAEAAFAGIVREAAELRAFVERADRVGAQRAEAHRRDVEQRARIGLRAVAARRRARGSRGRRRRTRRHRMIDPLVIAGVDVELGAERALVELTLGALIDDRAFGAVERRAVGVALEEILADLRADLLEKETDVGEDRIVALEAVIGLNHVPRANGGERDAEQRDHHETFAESVRNERAARPNTTAPTAVATMAE